MAGHMQSTGRGGAGNIGDTTQSPPLQPKDLETPTLKTDIITTGRGGAGNMARNLDPTETRKRQDVEPVARRPSFGPTHVGRGGAANVAKEGSPDGEEPKKQQGSAEPSLAAKGKEWLFGKKA